MISTICFGNESEVKEALSKVSKSHKIHYVTLSKIADIESGFNPVAKNPNSSARGLFQITEPTQRKLLKDGARVCDIFNAECNTEYAAILINLNIKYLRKKLCRDYRIRTYEVYLAHFFGANTAYRFLIADPNSIASEVFPKEAKYNPNIFKNRTIEEVGQLFKDKIKDARIL
jgi:hypothetical protein